MAYSKNQENINKIESLYKEFQKKLTQLKEQRQAIVSKFIEHLENTKLNQIRKNLK